MDEPKKPAVTDSRFAGFNPEVEESKAAAEAALHTPEPAKPEPKVDPPAPRHPFDILGDIEAWVRSVHGSHPRFEELMAELWSSVKEHD
jgi:hypothetical protein